MPRRDPVLSSVGKPVLGTLLRHQATRLGAIRPDAHGTYLIGVTDGFAA